MISPENRLFCRLDNMSASEREQKRLQLLEELGLLEPGSIPIFDEVTQTAAHLLEAPICILGILDGDRQLFKSAVGLSRISLMNDLASSRQLPRHEAFCTYVIDSHQTLAIHDTTAHLAFADSSLTQRYGIRAYLGVPLLTSAGHCIGTLAIMELAQRHFTAKDVECLELIARWGMSEFERSRLLKHQPHLHPHRCSPVVVPPTSSCPDVSPLTAVKVDLITQMTQELRTPLTSILGMASVLNREIYGPLTDRQKKYMDVIHNSGQYLLTLVNEILELGALDDSKSSLDLSPIDIEMLCQQSISTLEQAVQRREQQIRLTVEPGLRIWLLDKDKVRQMLYHLVFSVIQLSSTDSIIRIHVSRKHHQLILTIWTSHPWLGDGLPQAALSSNQIWQIPDSPGLHEDWGDSTPQTITTANNLSRQDDNWDRRSQADNPGEELVAKLDSSRQSLGLMLSRRLAEAHGGQITIQGSPESGYRYVINLPKMGEVDE